MLFDVLRNQKSSDAAPAQGPRRRVMGAPRSDAADARLHQTLEKIRESERKRRRNRRHPPPLSKPLLG